MLPIILLEIFHQGNARTLVQFIGSLIHVSSRVWHRKFHAVAGLSAIFLQLAQYPI